MDGRRMESVRPRRRRLRASATAWWEGNGHVAIGLGLILMGCWVAAGLLACLSLSSLFREFHSICIRKNSLLLNY
jgi:Na+/phosphate symporter